MSRFITFNGLTLVHPGGLTRVDTNALAQVGPNAVGVIGLIGEAAGGEPDVAYIMDDPSTAKEVFRSGPLADAVRMAFEPSSDPRVPGGAFRVIAVKPNASTQSTLTLEGQLALGTNGEDQAELTSIDYGVHTSQLTWSFEEDAVDSSKFIAKISEVGGNTEEIVDIGGRPLMNLVFKGPEEDIVLTGAWGVAGEASSAADGLAGDVVTIVDSSIVAASVTVDTDFVRILGAGSQAGEIRRITAVTNGVSLTVVDGELVAGFSGAIADTTPYEILTGMRVATLTVDSATNTAPASTITLDAAEYLEATTTVGDLVGKAIRVVDGEGQGQVRTIASVNVGGAAAVVLTLAAGDYFTTAPVNGDTIALLNVEDARATITGTLGKAAELATTVDIGAGLVADQAITLAASKTVADVVAEINAIPAVAAQPTAGSDYLASVGSGRTGAAAEAGSSQLFDFDGDAAGEGNYQVDILADTDLAPTSRSRLLDNLNMLIEAVNQYSGQTTMVRSVTSTDPNKAGAGIPLYYTEAVPAYLAGGVRGTSDNSDWQDAFDELLKHRVNTVVPLISENLANDVGAYGSTATVASVHAQLISHLNTAAGIGKSERNGYAALKVSGASALTTLLAKATALNNVHCSLVFGQPDALDVDGNLQTQPEWAQAVIAAGMQAGSPIGEPLTFKYVKAAAMTYPSTIDVLDRTTSNRLQLGGVLFTEFVRGKGHRWVRDITTWLGDDNLANTDRHVREVLDFIAYDVRTDIEDRFTGLRATPATVSGIKSRLEVKQESYRKDGIIVDSQDPTTGEAIRAYQPAVVTISGDVATIKLDLFPVTGINFQKIELRAQLPVISA